MSFEQIVFPFVLCGCARRSRPLGDGMKPRKVGTRVTHATRSHTKMLTEYGDDLPPRSDPCRATSPTALLARDDMAMMVSCDGEQRRRVSVWASVARLICVPIPVLGGLCICFRTRLGRMHPSRRGAPHRSSAQSARRVWAERASAAPPRPPPVGSTKRTSLAHPPLLLICSSSLFRNASTQPIRDHGSNSSIYSRHTQTRTSSHILLLKPTYTYKMVSIAHTRVRTSLGLGLGFALGLVPSPGSALLPRASSRT